MVTVEVATATASGSGGFTAGMTVPADTPLGQYEVIATGVDAAGDPYALSAPLKVVAATAATPRAASAAKPSGGLARTGINPLAPQASALPWPPVDLG